MAMNPEPQRERQRSDAGLGEPFRGLDNRLDLTPESFVAADGRFDLAS
jgi:hypothetical protein